MLQSAHWCKLGVTEISRQYSYFAEGIGFATFMQEYIFRSWYHTDDGICRATSLDL
jgi:hypothetical protein